MGQTEAVTGNAPPFSAVALIPSAEESADWSAHIHNQVGEVLVKLDESDGENAEDDDADGNDDLVKNDAQESAHG